MPKRLTQFQLAIRRKINRCDICGEVMRPMFGGGWDNDRLICAARECGAEVVFPTSTPIDCGSADELTTPEKTPKQCVISNCARSPCMY